MPNPFLCSALNWLAMCTTRCVIRCLSPLVLLASCALPALAQPEVLVQPWDDAETRALEILDGAQQTVDVAQYNVRNERFFDKLSELRARGVRVRIVVDAKNAEKPWNTLDDRFEAAGFDLVRYRNTGHAYAIMHHKFTVVDGATVMTGSYNWNTTAQLVNDEVMLVLRDAALAAAYQAEFEELRGAPELAGVGGTPGAEVLFAPEDRPRDAVLAAIRGAQRRIRVAMFSFRDRDVARALRDAARRGVEVTLLTEQKQADTTNADETVASGGARVVVAANRSAQHSAMHHKFAVIDDALVLAGACNWTWTAFNHSNEDVLVLRDATLAQRFTAAFGALVRRYDPAGFVASDYGIQAADGATHFVVRMPRTGPGDAVVLVGDHPALGSWDPRRGVVLRTGSIHPTWTTSVRLPAGATVSYKAVLRRADGTHAWELGADRVLTTDPSGANGFVEFSFRDLLDVTFRVRAALPPGGELRLAGADVALGKWDPALAWPLLADPQDPGSFKATVPLTGRVITPVHLVLVAADGTVRWSGGWDQWIRIHDRDAPQVVDLGGFQH